MRKWACQYGGTGPSNDGLDFVLPVFFGKSVYVGMELFTSLIWEVEGPMKNTLLAFLALAVWMTFVQAKEPAKPPNFSGKWVLNFGQTKNPPDGLQRYSLVVNQDDQQLKVETTLQGDLQSAPNTPNSGGYPGGSGRRGGMGGGLGLPGGIGIGMGIPVGMGIPGVGMGIPRGGGGRSRSGGTFARECRRL